MCRSLTWRAPLQMLWIDASMLLMKALHSAAVADVVRKPDWDDNMYHEQQLLVALGIVVAALRSFTTFLEGLTNSAKICIRLLADGDTSDKLRNALMTEQQLDLKRSDRANFVSCCQRAGYVVCVPAGLGIDSKFQADDMWGRVQECKFDHDMNVGLHVVLTEDVDVHSRVSENTMVLHVQHAVDGPVSCVGLLDAPSTLTLGPILLRAIESELGLSLSVEDQRFVAESGGDTVSNSSTWTSTMQLAKDAYDPAAKRFDRGVFCRLLAARQRQNPVAADVLLRQITAAATTAYVPTTLSPVTASMSHELIDMAIRLSEHAAAPSRDESSAFYAALGTVHGTSSRGANDNGAKGDDDVDDSADRHRDHAVTRQAALSSLHPPLQRLVKAVSSFYTLLIPIVSMTLNVFARAAPIDTYEHVGVLSEQVMFLTAMRYSMMAALGIPIESPDPPQQMYVDMASAAQAVVKESR